MPDPSASQVQAQLRIISQLLREPHRLSPEAQAALADLVDELGKTLATPEVPSEKVARLSECAAYLVQAVHEQHESGLLAAARARLDHAVVAVETEAPGLASLTRRVAELLSNIGI